MHGDTSTLPPLLGLVGPSGSGKDEVARILDKNWGYTRVAIADPIKEATAVIFGLNHDQLWGDERNTLVPRIGLTPREAFQRVGDGVREVNPSLWLTLFAERILEAQLRGRRVVCPDVRTNEELTMIGSLSGQCWRVIRPGAGAPGGAGDHDTEKALIDLPEGRFDAIVNNEGDLRELEARCRKSLDAVGSPDLSTRPGQLQTLFDVCYPLSTPTSIEADVESNSAC